MLWLDSLAVPDESLINKIPDYKIGYVLAYVQGVAADEEADDIFCQRMVENYENVPDGEKERYAV